MTEARDSRVSIEALVEATAEARDTRVSIEALVAATAEARDTRVSIESLVSSTAEARDTRASIEALVQVPPVLGTNELRVARVAIEAFMGSVDGELRIAREALVVTTHYPEADTATRIGRVSMSVLISFPHGFDDFDDPAS